jgi:hypothetical protein
MGNCQKRTKTKTGLVVSGSTLELKTSVVGQTYCSSDNLRLSLRLAFLNTGSETLILYRRGSAIARYMVSKDLNASRKRRYEYDVSPMLTPRMPPEVDGATPNEDLFVRLKAGEAFTMDKDAYFRMNDGSSPSKSLKPGPHVLQLRVATLYLNPAIADVLAVRWRNLGVLWSNDVISIPMEFLIEPYKSSDTCQ